MSEIDWSIAPEGATHKAKHGAFFKLDVSGVFIHSNGKWEKLGWAGWQLDAFEKRPSAWSGEGLPPVGQKCLLAEPSEYYKPFHPEWSGREVKIYAHFESDSGVKLAAYVGTDNQIGGVGYEKAFMPIRTPEQIAEEERQKAVLAIGQILINNRGSCNEYHLAGLLHDAGYRKVES